MSAPGGLKSRKFPVFSLFNREFSKPETGSLQTASSASQSSIFGILCFERDSYADFASRRAACVASIHLHVVDFCSRIGLISLARALSLTLVDPLHLPLPSFHNRCTLQTNKFPPILSAER